jgi:hypothetical protein
MDCWVEACSGVKSRRYVREKLLWDVRGSSYVAVIVQLQAADLERGKLNSGTMLMPVSVDG